jgi:hypothetical protein
VRCSHTYDFALIGWIFLDPLLNYATIRTTELASRSAASQLTESQQFASILSELKLRELDAAKSILENEEPASQESSGCGMDQVSSITELMAMARPGSNQISSAYPAERAYPGVMRRILGRSAAMQPVSTNAGSTNKSAREISEQVSSAAGPSTETQDGFNNNRFVEWMHNNALSRSAHRCAMFVRHALEAAGMSTADRPSTGDAGDYGPYLQRHGAQVVPIDEEYVPKPGDTAVFAKTDEHPNGHIEVFDGEAWVSDFRQRSFSPYRDVESTPPVTMYRLT